MLSMVFGTEHSTEYVALELVDISMTEMDKSNTPLKHLIP